MKTTIFSGLVWTASSVSVKLHADALAGSTHLLLTLRGWAVAALVISVLMQLFGRERFRLRQIPEAVVAFALFSAFVATLILVVNGAPATVVTIAAGVLAPVIAVMALEFPDLRPRALTLGAILGTGLVSCAFAGVLAANPSPGLRLIRTKQVPKPAETVHHPNGPARA